MGRKTDEIILFFSFVHFFFFRKRKLEEGRSEKMNMTLFCSLSFTSSFSETKIIRKEEKKKTEE